MRITCVCVPHWNVACWTQQACVYLVSYCMQRHSNERRGDNHDKRPTLVECTTLDGQAHLNLARPRQYRAWVTLYNIYNIIYIQLLDLLTSIFNRILISGEYPEVWSEGIICPIYKAGERTDPRNTLSRNAMGKF